VSIAASIVALAPAVADPLSEERLALLAQAGCATSFEQLVRRVQVPLVQFLMGRTRCRADAEDLAQESLVRAFRALGRYQPRYRFRTWLFTIAHRLSLNHRRGEHRAESIVDPDAIRSPTAEAADLLSADEWRRSVWRLADELLDADQTAGLWLHYVEELSTEEIGRILGRSRTAVKTMLFRARKKLRPGLRALVGKGDDADDAIGAERFGPPR
jgi:RNA polymerase sigma-70 factor (ECF subfamily)